MEPVRRQKVRESEHVQGNLAETVQPGLMSVAGASRYIGYSPSVIYQMIKTGELRSFTWRRRRCIPKTELDRWMAEQLAAQNDGDYGDTSPAA
jgi:excisionase family DNA binding protein